MNQEHIEKFVRACGKHFVPRVCPRHIRRGAVGDCFDHCILVAMEQDMLYCEGIAENPLTGEWMYHAWLTDGNGVFAFDPTWKFLGKYNEGEEIEFPMPIKYIGVAMEPTDVSKFMIATGYKGVLANSDKNAELALACWKDRIQRA